MGPPPRPPFALYATLLSVHILVLHLPSIRLFGLDAYIVATFSPSPLRYGIREPQLCHRTRCTGVYWQGTYRAEGLVLICCMVSDAVDTIMISLRGMEGKALAHGVGCVVLELTGWELLG